MTPVVLYRARTAELMIATPDGNAVTLPAIAALDLADAIRDAFETPLRATELAREISAELAS